MIILTIKTDSPEAEVGLYENHDKLGYIKWMAHRQLADTLHLTINELLKSNKKDWQDINGVIVYSGPGSFTGLRIGISVANSLTGSLSCLGVGSKGDDWINDGINKLAGGKTDKIIKAEYGSEAHITLPKH